MPHINKKVTKTMGRCMVHYMWII